MRAMEAVDRFIYGAVSLLLMILIGIGGWEVRTIINHEIRLSALESMAVKVDQLHEMDKRLLIIESRDGTPKIIGVVHASEPK